MRSLVFAALLLVTSCASFHGREDLDIAAGKHHIDLRWGRLENAAVAVMPEKRAAFLESWAKRAGQIELQEVDVAGVVMAPDNASADVIVNLTYVERETMMVKQATMTEHWLRTADGWFIDTFTEL
jgi:hypothetical protein